MSGDRELLNIKQAAAFLGVSETSLRRWTNAGLLRSFRIGGRRERRFRREDLVEFLKRAPASAPATLLGHLCGFYSSGEGRIRQAAAFLTAGLRDSHACILAATPEVREQVLSAMKRDAAPGSEQRAVEQLEYLDAADAQLESWTKRLEEVVRPDVSVIRAVGDVSGSPLAGAATFEELMAFEARFESEIARRFPVYALCLYDARVLSGLQAHRVLAGHPDTLRYPAGPSVD